MAKPRKSTKEPKVAPKVDAPSLAEAIVNFAWALERDALHKLTHPFAKIVDNAALPAPAETAAEPREAA